MTRTILIAIAAVAVTIGVASAEPPAVSNYSPAEINSLLRSAHTVEQYQMLASYFRSRQVAFEAQAQWEKQEWERRSQNTTGVSQKYPRPVDSSKNRYEYFTYEADQMGQQAAHFEGLSATTSK